MHKVSICLFLLGLVGCGTDDLVAEPGALVEPILTDDTTGRWCDSTRVPECPDGGPSCFEADTLILTETPGGDFKWIRASLVTKANRLAALDETSTLAAPSLKAKAIKTLSRDHATSALYAFSLDNGSQLKVTANHPMMLSDGRVVQARRVGVGTQLVSVDGSVVHVANLAIEHTERPVYNFEVEATQQMGHIIAAGGGVLVGDLALQDKLATGN